MDLIDLVLEIIYNSWFRKFKRIQSEKLFTATRLMTWLQIYVYYNFNKRQQELNEMKSNNNGCCKMWTFFLKRHSTNQNDYSFASTMFTHQTLYHVDIVMQKAVCKVRYSFNFHLFYFVCDVSISIINYFAIQLTWYHKFICIITFTN